MWFIYDVKIVIVFMTPNELEHFQMTSSWSFTVKYIRAKFGFL